MPVTGSGQKTIRGVFVEGSLSTCEKEDMIECLVLTLKIGSIIVGFGWVAVSS